jgi:hypothetical protein
LFETAGAALSFGWDFAVTLLADWSGNDVYSARIISIGLSQIRSQSFFFDFAGNDLYSLDQGTPGMGEASFRESFRTPRPITPFPFYASSYGILIDIGGEDGYFDRLADIDSVTERQGIGNDTTWYRPSRESGNFGHDNYGIGVDSDSGSVDELMMYQRQR